MSAALWRVENNNWAIPLDADLPLRKALRDPLPWRVFDPDGWPHGEEYATHAEAIAYADRMARGGGT